MTQSNHSDFELSQEDIPDDLIIHTRAPQPALTVEESLEFHAARLLLLLKYAGGRNAKITGRTKLAKMDFFLRYPTYLAKALDLPTETKLKIRPESPMIRYKYGPWDPKYYDVFALLVGLGLMEVKPSEKGDVFSLTERGEYAVEELQGPEFEDIIERCKQIYNRFGKLKGNQIKEYIYREFPEIVVKTLGEEIE
ncbi:MAG TPA: hypothetical protein VF679_07085 [Pedobacter sp.]